MFLTTEFARHSLKTISARLSKSFRIVKFPYYKKLGYPQGSYRVGPLARLNVAKSMGTPLADEELKEFKKLSQGSGAGFVPLSLRATHRHSLRH